MPKAQSRFLTTVTVPGARKIVIRQQRRGWDPATARTLRRYETIKTCTHPGRCVKKINTGKVWAGGVHYEWQDKVRVIATFGRGPLENTKTWTFAVREETEAVFECNSCIEAATPSPVEARTHTKPGPGTRYEDTKTGSPFAGWRGTGFSVKGPGIITRGADAPDFTLKQDTIKITTPSEGEKIVEVLVVDGLQAPNGTADMGETVDVAEEEIDTLVDDGIVVELPEEVAVVIDSVAETPVLPTAAPGMDKELLYPGAGAAVGAVAGKLLGESPLLGGLVGGVAGWWFGRDA